MPTVSLTLCSAGRKPILRALSVEGVVFSSHLLLEICETQGLRSLEEFEFEVCIQDLKSGCSTCCLFLHATDHCQRNDSQLQNAGNFHGLTSLPCSLWALAVFLARTI